MNRPIESKEPGKKPYEKLALKDFGTVTELTSALGNAQMSDAVPASQNKSF